VKILNGRGVHVRTGKPQAFANDWIAVAYTDGQIPAHGIVRPDRVQLESKTEWDAFANRNPAVVGHFWQTWGFNEQGRFYPLNRAPLRRRQTGRRR
jgi:hypothetical protein